MLEIGGMEMAYHKCRACNGTGYQNGEKCPVCHGIGEVY